MDRFETALEALAALPDLSMRGGAKNPLEPYSSQAAEQEYRALKEMGGSLITAADTVFPVLLRQINGRRKKCIDQWCTVCGEAG